MSDAVMKRQIIQEDDFEQDDNFENAPRSSTLSVADLFTISWRSIRSNLLRSILTALGVIIGVAAVVALVTVGNGVRQNVTNQFSSLGTNLLTVSSGSGGFGGPSQGGLVRGSSSQTVTIADAEAIVELGDTRVVGVAPVAQSGGQQIKVGATNANATVIGTWPEYATVQNTPTQAGSFFTSDDNDTRKRVVVIGSDVATELFPDTPVASIIGQELKIANIPYQIVGVLEEKGTAGFNNPNTNVYIPINTFYQRINRTLYNGEFTVNSVSVQATDSNVIDALQTDLTTLMATRHEKTSEEDYDFNIRNQADQLETVTSVFSTLTLFLGAVAGISLVVGGIGIMNIMLVSVTERTREIGVRKALGAKPFGILSQFLLEAILLSCVGGLIGIVLGVAIGYFATNALSVPFVVSVVSMGLAFGFSAAVGIFFGFYPAQRAARLDPVESLRYE
jgi:putative ABC transport system permease protein